MKRFKNILAYINTHSEEQPGFEKALQLASANRARLTVVDMVGDFPHSKLDQEVRQVIIDEKRQKLSEIEQECIHSGIEIKTDLVVGKSFLEIIRMVLRNNHDLVIKTAEMPEMFGTTSLFSVTDKHLLRKCPCPVWLVKKGQKNLFEKIVAAIDPTTADPKKDYLNRKILELALSLTERNAAELSIVHVWSATGETLMKGRYSNSTIRNYITESKTNSENKLAAFLAEFDISIDDPRVVMKKGLPAETITRFVKESAADCVIMGTLSRRGIMGLLIGNTAEQVLDSIDCSVLTVKPGDFVTPVSL